MGGWHGLGFHRLRNSRAPTRTEREHDNVAPAALRALGDVVVKVFPDGTGLGPEVLTTIADAAEQALQRELEKYRARKAFAGGRAEMGDPRAVIPRVARELSAGLIVIGSHGRRGFRRLLLGSVAEAVVREAPCAVLVVRAPPPPASDGTGT